MTISVVFDPPLRSDSPAVFNSKAFTLVGDLNKWSNEANALASDVTSKQTTASNAATTATNQADLANSSRIAAQDAAAAAAASYDSFDDRYLGAKASDPTLDNDGNALIEGALYWNSTVKEHRTWNGTAWVTTSVANAVSRGGDTMTGNLNVPSLNGGQLAGHRNKIINGDMAVAVRGSSFPAATGYTVDRWIFTKDGATVVTVSKQAGDLAVTSFNSSLRAAVTTADAAIAAGEYATLSQKVEGQNAVSLIGGPIVLSFWVRSAKTGTHCVALRNSGLDRSYVGEYTVSVANTFEYKSVVVTPGLITTGTWDFSTGVGVEVDFVLAAGTSRHTTAGSWQTGGFIATANQVNVLDTVGNIFEITGVQLERGDKPTPFERRMNEDVLCKRYARLNGSLAGWSHTTTSINGAAVDFGPVPMRAAPALTLVTGTSKGHDVGVALRDISAPGWSGTGNGGYIDCTIATTTVNKLHAILQDAILFTAEL